MSKLDDIINTPMSFIEAQTGEDVREDFKKQIKELVLSMATSLSRNRGLGEDTIDSEEFMTEIEKL